MNDTKFGKEYQKTWRQNNKEKVDKYNARRRQISKTTKEVAKRKAYVKKNKVRLKNYDLTRRYGITLTEYDAMCKQQSGKCLICGQNPKETQCRANQYSNEGKLVVDHDHTTKKVRGLLCAKCNRGLGYFSEDVNALQNAINYLRRQTG